MFPFTWIGAAFAAGVLAAAMVVFVVLARLLSVPEGGQSSIVPGLVSGLRDWSARSGSALRRVRSTAAADQDAVGEESSLPVGTEPVHGRVR